MAVNNQGKRRPPNRPTNTRQPQKSRDEVRREQTIKRRRLKKRKQIIFYTFSLFLLLVVAVILSLTVFFKVETITVEGKTSYSNDKVIKMSGINKNDNLFLIDKSKAAENIMQKLPYIGSVKISNKLPSGIVISVEKTTEKCAIANGEGYVLTNENSKVLQVGVTEIDEKLILISGGNVKKSEIGKNIEFENKETQELVEKIMESVKVNKIEDITQIDVSDKLNIKMTYQNRIEMLFGSISQIDKKMEFAVEVLEKENERSKNQEGIIDLQGISSDKGKKDKVYFRPKEEATTAPVEQTMTSFEESTTALAEQTTSGETDLEVT
ncbi:MAG: FtsQ-type POTRA domain-containing protein [Clostridia bacterium]|nr:FtsQ-type POTRA domain-containing protein [Clostridia bacterium]